VFIMKKYFNISALIIIICLVSSWDNCYITFKELLLWSGATLSFLLNFHFIAFLYDISRSAKKSDKAKAVRY